MTRPSGDRWSSPGMISAAYSRSVASKKVGEERLGPVRLGGRRPGRSGQGAGRPPFTLASLPPPASSAVVGNDRRGRTEDGSIPRGDGIYAPAGVGTGADPCGRARSVRRLFAARAAPREGFGR